MLPGLLLCIAGYAGILGMVRAARRKAGDDHIDQLADDPWPASVMCAPVHARLYATEEEHDLGL